MYRTYLGYRLVIFLRLLIGKLPYVGTQLYSHTYVGISNTGNNKNSNDAQMN